MSLKRITLREFLLDKIEFFLRRRDTVIDKRNRGIYDSEKYVRMFIVMTQPTITADVFEHFCKIKTTSAERVRQKIKTAVNNTLHYTCSCAENKAVKSLRI